MSPSDLPSARSSYTAAELEHAQRHRPPDRPDAYCVDCPFSDRGDFLVYRDEWDSLNQDRIESRRLRDVLRLALEWVPEPERTEYAVAAGLEKEPS